MVFSPRQVIFSKLFYCSSRRQQKLSKKGCFLVISEVSLGNFLAWFWNLPVLQRHAVFPPAGDFFEAVLLQQPQATEAVEKGCFFEDFRSDVRQFFGVVLELARPWSKKVVFRGTLQFFGVVFLLLQSTVFSLRRVIFSKLFYCSSRRQQKLSKKVVFPGFQKWR